MLLHYTLTRISDPRILRFSPTVIQSSALEGMPSSRFVAAPNVDMVLLSSTNFSGPDCLVGTAVCSIFHIFLRRGELQALAFQVSVEYSINGNRLGIQEVDVPIVASTKKGSADYVPQAGWNYALPDIEANGDAWRALPDALKSWIWFSNEDDF